MRGRVAESWRIPVRHARAAQFVGFGQPVVVFGQPVVVFGQPVVVFGQIIPTALGADP
jgi:hypothetical protein